jgi:hypothetical protein
MIYRIINKEKGFYKYIFTGRHIYCYIHALAETTIALKIAIKIIISYDNNNDADVKIYKLHLSEHNNYEEIIKAIDNMMRRKPVIYTEQKEANVLYESKMLRWFNNLYLDQKSENIMPPIKILESELEPENFIEEDRTLY